MGLDMYLERSISLYGLQEENPELYNAIKEIDELLPNSEIKSIRSEIGYWRKANAIHKWFVDHVQDGVDECQRSEVDIAQLLALKVTCETVLADPDVAGDLLPPTSGFFFGSDQIDEWYFEDLKNTIKIIDNIVKVHDQLEGAWIDYYYQASW